MDSFKDIIQHLEDHTGEPFDYSIRRHRFLLRDTVNRIINEANRVKADVRKVLEDHRTFDPEFEKVIRKPKNS